MAAIGEARSAPRIARDRQQSRWWVWLRHPRRSWLRWYWGQIGMQARAQGRVFDRLSGLDPIVRRRLRRAVYQSIFRRVRAWERIILPYFAIGQVALVALAIWLLAAGLVGGPQALPGLRTTVLMIGLTFGAFLLLTAALAIGHLAWLRRHHPEDLLVDWLLDALTDVDRAVCGRLRGLSPLAVQCRVAQALDRAAWYLEAAIPRHLGVAMPGDTGEAVDFAARAAALRLLGVRFVATAPAEWVAEYAVLVESFECALGGDWSRLPAAPRSERDRPSGGRWRRWLALAVRPLGPLVVGGAVVCGLHWAAPRLDLSALPATILDGFEVFTLILCATWVLVRAGLLAEPVLATLREIREFLPLPGGGRGGDE